MLQNRRRWHMSTGYYANKALLMTVNEKKPRIDISNFQNMGHMDTAHQKGLSYQATSYA